MGGTFFHRGDKHYCTSGGTIFYVGDGGVYDDVDDGEGVGHEQREYSPCKQSNEALCICQNF